MSSRILRASKEQWKYLDMICGYGHVSPVEVMVRYRLGTRKRDVTFSTMSRTLRRFEEDINEKRYTR